MDTLSLNVLVPKIDTNQKKVGHFFQKVPPKLQHWWGSASWVQSENLYLFYFHLGNAAVASF